MIDARSAALAALLFACTWSPAARADAVTDEAKSRALFDRAIVFADKGDWDHACPLFREAHEVRATGGTAVRLAMCHERAGEVDKAIALYKYVVDNPNSKFPDRTEFAKKKLEELKSKATPAATATASATGAAATTTAATGTAQAPAGTAPAPAGKSIIPAVAVFGVGAVGLGFGIGFGAVALSEIQAVKATCTNNVCPTSQRDAASAADTKGWISNVGFGVAIVGVAAGVVLLVMSRDAPPKQASWLHAAPGGVAIQF